MNNPVEPDHYKIGGIETIDIIASKLTHEGFKGYMKGNILKYIIRYENKGGSEDLRKAGWYLDKLTNIEESEEKKESHDVDAVKNSKYKPKHDVPRLPEGANSYRPFDETDDTPEC
jgi:hypothetical protein